MKKMPERLKYESNSSQDELYQMKRKAFTAKNDEDWNFMINRQQFNHLPKEQQWAIETIGNSIYK